MYIQNAGSKELRAKMNLLESSLLFRHWAVDRLYLLANMMRSRKFGAGAHVCRKGTKVEGMALVARGALRVFTIFDVEARRARARALSVALGDEAQVPFRAPRA